MSRKFLGGGYRLSDLRIQFNPSKKEISNLHNMEVSFIPMDSLGTNGKIAKQQIKNIDELRKGAYSYFRENDILLAKITPCMENGKCAIATDLKNGLGMGSSEFHVFRVDSTQVLPAFLFGYLNRRKIRDAAQKNMTGASGHRRVPIEFYKNLEIKLPSMEEQKKICERVDVLEREMADLESSLPDLPNSIKSILEEYLKQ